VGSCVVGFSDKVSSGRPSKNTGFLDPKAKFCGRAQLSAGLGARDSGSSSAHSMRNQANGVLKKLYSTR
jgi:hypothetical protein